MILFLGNSHFYKNQIMLIFFKISYYNGIVLVGFGGFFYVWIFFLHLFLGPRNNDMSQPTYSGFERDVFRTVADYFLSLPEPLLTFEYYELFVNILGTYEFRNNQCRL